MKTLVYIEAAEGRPLGASLEALSAALSIGDAEAVVVGSADIAEAAAAYGCPVAFIPSDDTCTDAAAALLGGYIAGEKPDAVFFAATQAGKDLAPMLAARLSTGCVTDAVALEFGGGDISFTRPAYGGTVLEQLSMNTRPQIATLRGGSWQKPTQSEAPAAVTAVNIPLPDGAVKARIIEAAKEITEAINLEGADVVVAGGRGMGTAEGFALVEELAAVLGGVVGASRPAMEAGWVSRAHQIGQSGKFIAPRLYIACGISGAMQHVSGVTGAKYIVAVNKDDSAPIFGIADLGIVGDVKDILPVMIAEIRKRAEA